MDGNAHKVFEQTISVGLGGSTKSQPWHAVGSSHCVLIRASGGEFRFLCTDLPQPPEETRGNGVELPCIVFGQHENTQTNIGLENPFQRRHGQCCPIAGTSDPRLLVTGNNTFRDFWISWDTTTGWFCVGCGHQPGTYFNSFRCAYESDSRSLGTNSLVIQARLPARSYRWFTISNWKDTVSYEVYLSSTEFPRAGTNLITNMFRGKFYENGAVSPCHGMTIVCPVAPQSALFQVASEIQKALAANEILAPHCGILDSSSLHMTVADLVFSPVLEDVQHHYPVLSQRLENIMRSAPWTRFTMVVEPDLSCSRSIRLTMTPYSNEAKQGLESWREAVYGQVADISLPQTNYYFHVTLAYMLYPLYQDDYGRQELARFRDQQNEILRKFTGTPFVFPPPVLSVFQNMNAFPAYQE